MLVNDLRYALRTLRRAPVFTGAAIVTMALTIGANTAIFSVVNAVMLRPLPFRAPDRLMRVAEKNEKLNLPFFGASVLNYLSWKEQARGLDLAALGFANFTLTGRGDPEQFQGATITPSLMPVLGIEPVRGRGFREGEDRPGGEPVAIISEGLWTHRFGGEASVIGSHVNLSGVDYTIVGIAPPALNFMTGAEIWTPLLLDPGREIRLNHVINVVGRLRPGVSMRQAQTEMDAIAGRMAIQYPELKDWGVRLQEFYHWFVQDNLRTALIVLLSAVGLVLLIACANVANLQLARASARQKEIAVRTALGAGRARMLGQLLTESLLLACAGGGAGLLAAMWTVKLMNRALPAGLLPVPDVAVDSTVLLFALGITLTTGLLFGLTPAWRAARADLNTVLKQGGRSALGGQRPWVRHCLVASELALCTVLLIGAGLLVQSLFRLQTVQLGFRPDHLLTFQLAPPPAKYAGQARQWGLYRDMLEAIRTLPGVRDVSISSGIPLGAGSYTRTPMSATGRSVLPAGAAIPIDWRTVSPGFFRTLEIPLLAGRDFNEQDTPTSPTAIIVSRRTAQRFWGDEDPIGKMLHRQGDTRNLTVVGVVGDVRNNALSQELPALYYAATTRVWPLMDVVVRTAGKPEAELPAVRRKIRELDAELPMSNVRSMEDWVSNSAAQPRINAVLVGVFAAVALLIAAIGVYGVLAYSVNQRTREIGLRMALGAQQSNVLRLIVNEGMMVGLAGIAAGLAGAYALSRALAALLFGVQARDPLTFAVVAATLMAIAFAACLVPAWRGSRIDPIVALREE
jgi:putative ABC transport system permease protein